MLLQLQLQTNLISLCALTFNARDRLMANTKTSSAARAKVLLQNLKAFFETPQQSNIRG